MTKPKTLEQLRADKERAETQLAQELHKLERLENRLSHAHIGVISAPMCAFYHHSLGGFFHCFHPTLPAFFGFWVKSGSEAVISGGTGELQPCATVHTIYPHTTNGVKASVSWVYLSITAVASASVTEGKSPLLTY